MTKEEVCARIKAIGIIQQDASSCGADDVVGVKTYVYDFGGGIIELLVIGTAIKKMPNLQTHSPLLIAQAIIKDTDTFTNRVSQAGGMTAGLPSSEVGY